MGGLSGYCARPALYPRYFERFSKYFANPLIDIADLVTVLNIMAGQ
jgi:hypothetical protein